MHTTPPSDSPVRRGLRILGSILIAFPLLLLVGVLLIFVYAGIHLAWSNYVKQRDFVPVRVTIVDKRELQNIRRSGPGGRNRTVEYQPLIVYRYEVNGESYESHRVWPERIDVDEEWANEVMQQYEVGQVYEGFYDPDKPSDAFLIQEYNPEPAITAGLALMMFLGIGAMVLQHRRASRRATR